MIRRAWALTVAGLALAGCTPGVQSYTPADQTSESALLSAQGELRVARAEALVRGRDSGAAWVEQVEQIYARGMNHVRSGMLSDYAEPQRQHAELALAEANRMRGMNP